MTEWWTYSLSDFLLFAPRTYFRLYELYNASIVPLQGLGLALGVLVACLLHRPSRARIRIAFGILAVAWLWIAVAFFLRHYATINWAAPWLAAGFVLQAVLLAAAAWAPPLATDAPSDPRLCRRATLFVATTVLGWPLVGSLDGRSWTGWEVFGVAPDPTAVGTLGAILVLRPAARAGLGIVPAAWCLVSAATLWTMGAWQAAAMAAALLAFALALPRRPAAG
jgi:hypothetical protein